MTSDRVGRYEIKEVLGRGGMAVVYRALDPTMVRDVAVKMLPQDLHEEPDFESRFRREAEIMASLEFSAVVPVYDFGSEGRRPYIVMRLMAGGSLRDRTDGPFSLDELTRLLDPVGRALDRAHAVGVVHRDLKPGNILMDLEGSPHIADFGIAKLVESGPSHDRTRIIGSPPYMSPEHWQGAQLQAASDLYSLGVMVFELLTGRYPYQSINSVGFMHKHLHEPVPSILSLRPDLPSGVQSVVDRSMAKDANDRYSTASQLVQELTTLAEPQGADHEASVESLTVASPTNLDLESSAPSGEPTGWFNSLGFVDGVSINYEARVVDRRDGKGRCVRFHNPESSALEFGSLMQRCPADRIAGKTIRFVGDLRARGVEHWAGLWLRVDGRDGTLFFDNMHNRPVSGDVDWVPCSIEATIPEGALWLNYGILLLGRGTVWAANLGLRVAGANGAWVDHDAWWGGGGLQQDA